VYSAGALLFALLHGQPPAGAGAKADPDLVPAALRRSLEAALVADPEQRTQSAQLLASQLASYTLELPTSGEFRLSLPSPSIRWVQASLAPAARVSLRAASREPPGMLALASHARTDSLAGPRVTDSLLRNPRFPSDRHSPWSKRWRQLRTHLASHPNVGVAWLFAVASLGAGIACALLAAWL
jgi:hypothetical protein